MTDPTLGRRDTPPQMTNSGGTVTNQGSLNVTGRGNDYTQPVERRDTAEAQMPDVERSRDAARQCAEWLAACISIGWLHSELDWLESLWWEHHDERGNLIPHKAAEAGAAVPRDPGWQPIDTAPKLTSYQDIMALDAAPSPTLPRGADPMSDDPVQALRKLMKESAAVLALAEPELRDIIGNTNLAVFKLRITEAADTLAALGGSAIADLLRERIKEDCEPNPDDHGGPAEYCWYCNADVNGMCGPREPHDANCWRVRVEAVIGPTPKDLA